VYSKENCSNQVWSEVASCQRDVWPDAAKLTNVTVTGSEERCKLVREDKMFVSKVKPRFQAEWEVSSEELRILACWSKNSVAEELRSRRLAVIQEEIC